MEFQVAQIVRSLAGRDKGALFCVVGVEGDFLRLADGKTRKVTRPKRKRRSHAEYVGTGDHPFSGDWHRARPWETANCGGRWPPSKREGITLGKE